MAKGKSRVQYLGQTGMVQGSGTQADWDFLYRHSTAKDPLYNIGDRVGLADGRVFRYAKCETSLTSQKFTCASHSRLAMNYSTDFVIASAATAGAKSVTITVASGETYAPGDEDLAATGVLALDELRGGMIDLYRGQDRQLRGITGNTALASDGTSITIYLDASLETAMEADDKLEVLNNPYAAVRASDAGWASILGVPATIATVGQYFWVQTWGICRITPQSAALGAVGSERQFCGINNGIDSLHTLTVTNGKSPQILGFLVERTGGVSGDAAPFVNLQINP